MLAFFFSNSSIAATALGYTYQTDFNKYVIKSGVEFSSPTAQGLAELVCATWTPAMEGSYNLRFPSIVWTFPTYTASVYTDVSQNNYVACESIYYKDGVLQGSIYNDNTTNGDYSLITAGCLTGQLEWIEYPAGTISNLTSEVSLIEPYCLNSCEYDVSVDILPNTDIVNPEIYGCTYDQNGFISGCTDPNTPVVYMVPYLSNGLSCVSSGGSVDVGLDPALTGVEVDLTPVVDAINNQTDALIGGIELLPDENTMLQGEAEFIEFESKVEGLGSGTYKPFGLGLTSLYPSLSFTGDCPIITSNVNLVYPGNSVNIDIFDVAMICDIFAFMRSAFDLTLFFLTWTFVYYQFVAAMRDI